MNRFQVSSIVTSPLSFGVSLLPRIRRDEVYRGGAILAASAGVSSLLMFGFQIILARELQPVGYATFGALIGVFAIFSQVGNALQMTVAKDVAGIQDEPARRLISSAIRVSMLAALAVFALFVLLQPLIADFLNIDTPLHLLLAGAASATLVLLSTIRGSLQGLRKFVSLSVSRIGEKVVWMVAGGALLLGGLGITGAFIGLILAILVMIAVGIAMLGSAGRSGISGIRPADFVRPSVVVTLTALGVATLANLDTVLAKNLFVDERAGVFSAIARNGKVIFFVALAFNRAIFPNVVRAHALGADTRFLLMKGIAVIAALTVVVVPVAALVARPLVRFTLGDAYAVSAGLVPWYALAISLMAMVAIVMFYHVAIGAKSHLIPLAIGLIMQFSLIWIRPETPFQLIAALILIYGVVLASSMILLFVNRQTAPAREGAGGDGKT